MLLPRNDFTTMYQFYYHVTILVSRNNFTTT